jgi:hypothetical protein
MPRLPRYLRLTVLLLSLASSATSISADEIDLNPDGTPVPKAKKSLIGELGTGYSIGTDLGWQPHLGGYLDLPGTWQAGLHSRFSNLKASEFYDYFPQISLEVRKLWLGDEGADPVRNSEYFSVSIGGFFAYEFNGEKIGLRPLGALSLGKYWMPFDKQPYGLDISLELSRFFAGHLLDHSELVFITTSVAVFYAWP